MGWNIFGPIDIERQRQYSVNPAIMLATLLWLKWFEFSLNDFTEFSESWQNPNMGSLRTGPY